MTFFYDLNKRLADLAKKQDAKQLSESATVTESPLSELAKAITHKGGETIKTKGVTKHTSAPGVYGGPEKVTHALDKLKGPKESVDKKAFAKLAPPTDKITFADKIAGAKKEVDEMLGDVAAEAMKSAIGKGREQVADEGNAFTGKLKSTPKGGKFKLGNKEFTDNSDIDEGFKEMDAWLSQREKEKGTGKFDKKKISTGTVYTRRMNDEPEDSDEEKSSEPKRRGRPKGKDKGPERVTAKSYKYKDGRPAKKVKEADSHVCEYCGHALEGEEEIVEKAVSKKQQKFMGMVHATQKGEKPASKEVAKVAKEMPKKAAKDFAATKHKGLPEKVKAKKEESKEEVEETTTSGSVATASTGAKAGKGGFNFGGGVYEAYNSSVEGMISEGMSVNISIDEQGKKSISVNATEQDAEMLADLLKMAGLNGERQEVCSGCGSADCSCDEIDENSPDWPTNTETLKADPNLRTYSGGLNGPKSTGQTTTPVIASQLRRQVSMEENVELERSLFKLYKDISGK